MLDYATVHLRLLAFHYEMYAFTGLPSQVSDHSGQPVEHYFNGQHPDCHDVLLEGVHNFRHLNCGLPQVVNQVIAFVLGFQLFAELVNSVTIDYQLSYLFHQAIQAADIHPYGLTDFRCPLSLYLIVRFIARGLCLGYNCRVFQSTAVDLHAVYIGYQVDGTSNGIFIMRAGQEQVESKVNPFLFDILVRGNRVYDLAQWG